MTQPRWLGSALAITSTICPTLVAGGCKSWSPLPLRSLDGLSRVGVPGLVCRSLACCVVVPNIVSHGISDVFVARILWGAIGVDGEGAIDRMIAYLAGRVVRQIINRTT